MERSKFLVTGATGFIGGHIVRELLALSVSGQLDCDVVAVVRNAKSDHVHDLESACRKEGLISRPEQLTFFGGVDLLCDDAAELLVKAASGVTHVIHTAAATTVAEGPEVIIPPAIRGTVAVLRAIEANHSVRAVAMTSSVAAVRSEANRWGGALLTEDDWHQMEGEEATQIQAQVERFGGDIIRWLTESTTEEICSLAFARARPYNFAKMYSEKLARAYVEQLNQQGRDITLSTICPGMVIGPQLTRRITMSNSTLSMLLSGEWKFVPALFFTFVDVRQVARVHVQSCLQRSQARFLSVGHDAWQTDIIKILEDEFPCATLPSSAWTIPKPFLYVVAIFSNRANFHFIRTRVGVATPSFEGSKAHAELGVETIPLRDTVVDAAHAFVEVCGLRNNLARAKERTTQAGGTPWWLAGIITAIGAAMLYAHWRQ